MRDKPDKVLDIFDPFGSFDPEIKREAERIQQIADECIVSAFINKAIKVSMGNGFVNIYDKGSCK